MLLPHSKILIAIFDILSSKLQTASLEEAAKINREIQLWENKAKVIKDVGKVGESLGKQFVSGWGSVKSVASGIDNITTAIEGNDNAWKSSLLLSMA